MKIKLIASLPVVALLLFYFNAYCQNLSNKGNDFWIGYGNHVRMFNKGNPEEMQLYITSDISTSGQVDIPALGFKQAFSVTANRITTIDIPRSAALLDEGKYDYGIHVTAAQPIVVYSFIYVNAISGATVCLPTNTLGKQYYSVNYTQLSNEANSYSYFFVIATEDNTTVEITPSETTKGGNAAGVPFTQILNKGQIYQVLSSNDLTGSTIRSISSISGGCKRIAVFCGSGKIAIGCNSTGSSDNLYQQMYPTATWGKKYITVPGLINKNNYYRIIKSDPTATVTLNGSVIPTASFVNNFYYEFLSSTPNKIESDKPILVAQYFTTQRCEGNGSPGDPDMIYLNPVEQTIDQVTLNSMQPSTGTNLNTHFINVVLKNDPAAINTFKLDGASYTNFTTVPTDPAFVYAQITTTSGTHNVSCDTGFNIIAYGFGNAESYGYSGGTNLKDLYQFASIKNQYATVSFPATCEAAPFNFYMTFPYQPTRIQWKFNGLFPDETSNTPVFDSTWVVNGRQLYLYKLAKTYIGPAIGSYPLKIIAESPTADGCSGEQEIDFELQVFPKPQADFNFATGGCLTDSVHFTNQSNTGGHPIIKWFWNFDNGDTAITKNPVYMYQKPGTYQVAFSIVTDIGCVSGTTTKPVAMNAVPVATFTTAAPYCVKRAITFTDQSTTASGTIVKRKWDMGDGKFSTQISAAPFTYTYATAGSFKVTLQVETDKGCTSTVFSRDITVNETPKAGFTLPENCVTDPFSQFNDTSTIADGTAGQFNYLWNFGDGNNANTAIVKNPKHKYAATGVYPVQLIVTSNKGCTDSLTQSFTINGASPQSAFSITGGNELCSNQAIKITNNSNVDFGNIVKLDIYWDYSNDPTNKTTDNNVKSGKSYTKTYPEFYTPATKNSTIQVVAYSGENCLSSATQILSLKAIPELQFDTVAPVCADVTPFQLKGTVLNNLVGSGVFSGKGVSASGLFNPAAAGAGTDIIRYTFVASNSCTNFMEQPVKIFPLPVANAGPDEFVLEGGNATLQGSGSGNNIVYIWSPPTALNNNKLSQPIASPTDDIAYKLTVTSADGCQASDEVQVKVLKTLKIPNAFSPNGDGVHDQWQIEHLDSYPNATVEVYNRYGQLVFKSAGYGKAWDGTYNGNPLPVGTYYYIINPKNGRKQLSGFVDIIR